MCSLFLKRQLDKRPILCLEALKTSVSGVVHQSTHSAVGCLFLFFYLSQVYIWLLSYKMAVGQKNNPSFLWSNLIWFLIGSDLWQSLFSHANVNISGFGDLDPLSGNGSMVLCHFWGSNWEPGSGLPTIIPVCDLLCEVIIVLNRAKLIAVSLSFNSQPISVCVNRVTFWAVPCKNK